jgi:hypothetical protein
MLSPEEEAYILTYAYIPEHIFGLMIILSGVIEKSIRFPGTGTR